MIVLKTLDRDQLAVNIMNMFDTKDWDRIRAWFPNLKECPTCQGTQIYTYQGADYACDCQTQILLAKLYHGGNIPKDYHVLKYDDLISEDRDVLIAAIDDYVDNIKHYLYYGMGLTFSGDIGTGKTLGAALIGKELLKSGYPVYFVAFNDLIHAWGNRWNDEEARWLDTKLRAVSILIIDELATDSRNHSGFLTNGLESIVRFRTSNNKPTIITTNLASEQEKKIFKKSFSLLSVCNKRVETLGEDVRGKEIRERRHALAAAGERRPLC